MWCLDLESFCRGMLVCAGICVLKILKDDKESKHGASGYSLYRTWKWKKKSITRINNVQKESERFASCLAYKCVLYFKIPQNRYVPTIIICLSLIFSFLFDCSSVSLIPGIKALMLHISNHFSLGPINMRIRYIVHVWYILTFEWIMRALCTLQLTEYLA